MNENADSFFGVSLICCDRVIHIHILSLLWKVLNECEIVFFSVRHTIEEMDFRWKEEEPITLFNEELAEFDVVKFEVESKKASYVSGEAKFVLLFLIPFWHYSFEKPRASAKATTLIVMFGAWESHLTSEPRCIYYVPPVANIWLLTAVEYHLFIHSFRADKHNFFYYAESLRTIQRGIEHCRNLSSLKSCKEHFLV